MMLLWCLIKKFVLKFDFEKRGISNINPFYMKLSMEVSGKGLLHCYQQASSLIGNIIITEQICFCFINPTLVMSQTLRAFVV